MEVTLKKQTAFRLGVDLLERLKAKANKQNKSLNSYVECILMDEVYNEPNAETIEALEEAKAGKYAGVLTLADLNGSVEDFLKACE
ncbi:MAG: toxin-antitoxin system HicB family antitoxin [Mangrovibacterium sp.]